MNRLQIALNCRVYGGALALSTTLVCAAPTVSSADPPVALIDAKPVLASELSEASQGQVVNLRKQEYEIKRKALDALVDQKLLEAAAAKRGVTVTQLQQELESKLREPTDAEVEAFFLARPDQ